MFAYIALVAVCFVGAILQTTIGFGFPTFAMIFLTLLFPFPLAVTLTQSVGILGVAYMMLKYRKHIAWRALIPFLIPAVIFGLFFTWYSSFIAVQDLKLFLGAILIALSLYFTLFSHRIHVKATTKNGVIMGSLSGVLNGFYAMGGPPVALYLAPALKNKLAYISTANTYFFIFKIVALPLRFSQGAMQLSDFGYLSAGIVSMSMGTILGDKIMRQIPTKTIKTLIYIFVGVSGAIFIWQELRVS